MEVNPLLPKGMSIADGPTASGLPFAPAKKLQQLGLAAIIGAVTSICLVIPNSTIYVAPLILIVFVVLMFLLMPIGGYINAIASLGAVGVFLWYVIITFMNKDILEKMPESWDNVNVLIAAVAMLQCLLIAVGALAPTGRKWYFQTTWITMAFLILLMTIQHMTATFFRTNG